MSDTTQQVRQLLVDQPDILIGFVFRSVARDEQQYSSDLDVAVAARGIIPSSRKLELIDVLSAAIGRSVDLIDLLSTSPLVYRRAMTTGTCVLKRDTTLYADLLKKLWYDHADLLPLHELILRERRKRFARGEP